MCKKDIRLCLFQKVGDSLHLKCLREWPPSITIFHRPCFRSLAGTDVVNLRQQNFSVQSLLSSWPLSAKS